MPRVDVRHTADLSPADLTAVRELLWSAFVGEDAMTEADFEHCLGGMHVLVWDGDVLVGHGAVLMRRLLHRLLDDGTGRALRTGYVEGVAVHPGRRRQGHAHTVMAELERIVAAGYEVGALGTSDDGVPLYTSRGWWPWPGTTSAVTPDGVRRTPDVDGWILLWPPDAGLDRSGDLACDWREGDAW